MGKITVDSNGTGTVTVLGAVSNPTGVTRIESAKAIETFGDDAYIGGRRVELEAQTGIGGSTLQPLSTRVTDTKDTAVGGIAELVVPGECGWLVQPGAVRELAAAMREALTRPAAELEAMGRRGALRVNAAHDASAQGRRMAQLFRASRQERASTRLAPSV